MHRRFRSVTAPRTALPATLGAALSTALGTAVSTTLGMAFVAGSVTATDALAQQYPNRPIRMIVPWPPGQATDLAGRVVAQELSKNLGQPVVVENRAGAGGMLGTDAAAKATPDGYTILAGSSGPVTVNPLLQKAAYDPERDLLPVAMIGVSPYILVTHPSFPAKDIRDFIAIVKANPGKYSFGSSGTGATAHLISEWFNNTAGLQATHVPYKGSAPAITDLMANQTHWVIETAAATLPNVRAGKLKAYGVSLARGTQLAPEIASFEKAAGMTGFDVGAWLGIMVPAGTPKPIVDRLAAEVDRAMKAPETRKGFDSIFVEVDYRPTEEFARTLKQQKERFTDIIKRGNIKVE